MVDQENSNTQSFGEGAEYWDCLTVSRYLDITMNNLRQLQHRQRIKWKKRQGRNVYYLASDIQAFKEKRKK